MSRNKKNGICNDCINAMYIGEGDFICYECEGEPRLVIEDFTPTDEFCFCNGEYFEEESI